MELFVNGKKIDAKLESEKTIGDVLRSFEATCEENAAAVIGILVDDKKVTADDFDEWAKKTISPKTKIAFDVITKDAVAESFANLSKLFDALAQKMQEVPIELQNGKGKAALASIQQLADDIDLFCHTASLASLFPETYAKLEIDGKQFAEFFSELSPILSEFENALQSNDTVLVGDLSEYEICPRLKAVAKSLEVFNAS